MTGEDYKYNIRGSPIVLAGAENGIWFGFSLLLFSVQRIIWCPMKFLPLGIASQNSFQSHLRTFVDNCLT